MKKLDEKQHQYVGHIQKAHPDLEKAHQLGQGFVMMLTERCGGDLDIWLAQAEHSALGPVFVYGLLGPRTKFTTLSPKLASMAD